MSIASSLAIGFRRARRTPRLILFSWFAQLVVAAVVAIPMYLALDGSLRETLHGEILVERLDENWLLTFRDAHALDPVVRLFDVSVSEAGPFFEHTERVLRGGIAVPIGRFLAGLLFGWSLHLSLLTPLVVLGIISVVLNAVLYPAYIAAYRGDYPPTIAEFLSLGAAWFGPCLRLGLLAAVVYAALVYPVLDGLSSFIATITENAASERTPFVLYMLRNLIALLLLMAVSLSFDYARIRVVLERRSSAVLAWVAGVRFVSQYPLRTAGVAGVLAVVVLAGMAALAVVDAVVPQRTVATVTLFILAQQAYMVFRHACRASLFASETALFHSSENRS